MQISEPYLVPPTKSTQGGDIREMSKMITRVRKHRRVVFSFLTRQQFLRQDVKGTAYQKRVINPPTFKIHISKRNLTFRKGEDEDSMRALNDSIVIKNTYSSINL